MSGVITIAVIMCLSFTSCEEVLDEIFYKVTFDPMTDDVDAPSSQSAIKGEVKDPWGTAMTRPNRADYIFDGWYTEKEFKTKWNFATDKAAADMTLYAKWLEAVSVTFVPNNSVIIFPDFIKIAKGTKATEPQTLTPILACEGWYKEETFVTRWDFDVPVNESMTLYGNFLQGYTVTFNSNGGSEVQGQSVFDGKKVNKPADPTKTGNDFAGWYSNTALTSAWNFDSAVTQNITLYAKWTVTITFNSNGGSNVSEQVITSGTRASSVNNPTRSGFAFGGWYKDTGLTQAWVQGTDTFNIHTTLYAKWTLALDPSWYQITGSGKSFTAIKGSATIGTGTITQVIDAIRTDANNAACTIFFGNGEDWLDIGTEYIHFIDGWGAITLKGRITSAKAMSNSDSDECGTITIGNQASGSNSSIASVTSDADIRNTSTGSSTWQYAVLSRLSANNSTMTINGGTISVAATSTASAALQLRYGSYVINNATITATAGYAIQSNCGTNATLTISGTSKVTSQSGSAVYLTSNNLTVNDNVTISSGTGPAIAFDIGTVTINGGTITSAAPTTFNSGGRTDNHGTIRLGAVYYTNSTVNRPSTLIINGGTVSNTHSTNGYAISVRYLPDYQNQVYSDIKLNGGTITAPVTAINNLGYETSMITLSGGMQDPLVINGVVIPSVNADGDGNVTVDSGFNPTGIIKLNFVSPEVGKIAVINGLDSWNKFELTNQGFTLTSKYPTEDLFISEE